MIHRSFKPAKCKTSLKLATSRIKLMKNRKENHLKQLKRELAQLLESGQDQTARIRVEHLVREEKTLAAYDLLAIYCELIAARLPIIESQKNCPIDLKEAVTSVIFASPRCADIPELQDIRKHFTAKYGKEFVTAALEVRSECGVSRMLVEKLSANAPDGQTKLKILTAIAEEHNVEWDPKSFGQKETKPYDDLLNGPNAFDKVTKMYSEPPIVQAPPPHVDHAPQGHDQKHDAPVNYQQNLQSSRSSHNFASSDLSGSQSRISAAPHPQVRPSGFEYERTELRHYGTDENSFSSIEQNWNMEFKDATAAAQAAAESAERASMAARAAAELSIRGKITRQHSIESHKSNVDVQRDDKPQRSEDSPSEKKLSENRNQNPHMQREQTVGYRHENHYDDDDDDERFYKDDYGTAKRSGQSDSSRSEAATVDDKTSMNNFHEEDRYSRKSSFEEESVKSKRSASAYEMRGSKQASGQESNRSSCSSSSSDGHDCTLSPSHQKYTFDDSKDLFGPGNSHRGSDNIASTDVVFDSYGSDNDEIHFDKQPLFNEQETKFFSASLAREPSNCLPVNVEGSSQLNTSGPSEKHFSASHVSAQWFSPPNFDETTEKAALSSAQIDDLEPANFDDSSGHSSGSEDDFEKSNSRGKTDPHIPRYTENSLIGDSDDIDVDHGLKGSFEKGDSRYGRKQNLPYSSDERKHSDFTCQNKQNEGFGSRSWTNSLVSSDDATHCLSPQSSRLASVNKEQDTDDVYTSSGSAGTTMRSEGLFDNPESQNGKGLNFGTLTGGLRNKGYKIPPYTNIQLGDLSSSKGAADDLLTFTQNPPAAYEVGLEVNENSSTRSRAKNRDLGTENFEEEIPERNLKSKKESYVTKESSSLKTRTENYDLGADDFRDKHPQQKLWDKQEPSVAKERKEVYTKSKFSAPVTYFDPDDDDFEEHLPKQTSNSKVRGGSGFSRRTKGNLITETSSHSKGKRGSTSSVNSISLTDQEKQDNSENIPKSRPKSGRTSTPRPGPKEIQKSSAVEQASSPPKTAATPTLETSRTSSEEPPSRDSSLKKASHVHPKLPDYDSIAAQLQALRKNRG